MPFQIVRDDIVHMQVDAIVNAANNRLARGGGVCGAIFAAAGPDEMQAACDAIGHCDTGSAVATPGFALPARHVIHTVGPIWHGGGVFEEVDLRSCYRSSLLLAAELGDTSIAFPLISSGIYGYPKEQALSVALSEIRMFLQVHEMDVYLTVFDTEALHAVQRRFVHVAEYIDDFYVQSSPYARRASMLEHGDLLGSYQTNAPRAFPDSAGAPSAPRQAPSPQTAPSAATKPRRVHRPGFLRNLLKNLDAGFSATLMRMIDERGLKDSDVYKRANMSRQHFSKIRSNPNYQPKKQTVLALAIALRLSLDETRLLLERAGFALTHADERDVIVEYFIEQGTFDIYEINLALYAFDQPLLG